MKHLIKWMPIVLCALVLPMASAGCQSAAAAEQERVGVIPRNLRAGVPPQASQVAQGEGSLSYIATASGQLYLYDAHANRLIGTYTLRAGQEMILAEDGRAAIDGNEVTVNAEVVRGRTYIAYFLPLAARGEEGDGRTYRITPSPPAGSR